MPRMRTRAYNAKGRMFSDMSSYDMSNNYPLMRGIVIANNDELEIGRVKVRIYSIHGTHENGTKDEDLPWAYPAFFSASYDSGTFIIPEVNNTVWLLFEDGDLKKPVYIGSVYGKGVTRAKQVGNTNGEFRSQRLGKNEKPVEALSLDDKVVYKSPKGAKIVIKETKADEGILITDQLGQKIEMKSPLRLEASIANLENVDKQSLLDEEAFITVESINGSKVELKSTLENTALSVDLVGSKPVSFTCTTEKEGLQLKVGDVTIKVGEDVVVQTSQEEIKMSNGQIRLKGTKVYIDAEDVYLGGEG